MNRNEKNNDHKRCNDSNQYSESSIRSDYARLTKTLIAKGLTLTTMESCTSGQIVSLVTDTEGSSAVVKGAYVTYSNEAKIMQGVPAEIIEKYGVYSKETAAAMAMTCRKSYKSNIGIGVTGTLGNVDVNNADSVPGHVYFAIDIDWNGDMDSSGADEEIGVKSYADRNIYVYERELMRWPTRYQYKLEIARAVVDELLHKLFIK